MSRLWTRLCDAQSRRFDLFFDLFASFSDELADRGQVDSSDTHKYGHTFGGPEPPDYNRESSCFSRAVSEGERLLAFQLPSLNRPRPPPSRPARKGYPAAGCSGLALPLTRRNRSRFERAPQPVRTRTVRPIRRSAPAR